MDVPLAPFVLFAREIFFDSDDDCEIAEEENTNHFLENIQKMNTMQFKRHFRMDSHTFESLLQKMSIVYNPSKVGHPEISLEQSSLICIWYLANLESFRGVAARFGVSKSTAWAAVLRVSKAIILLNHRNKIIKWPSPQRCEVIRNYFFDKHNIPGIIGAIDGSHIRVVGPKEHANSYINRKGYHSIILQGICDHEKFFTDVYIGEAGSVHDYSVFLKSEVSRKPVEEFPNDSHLVGDLAYKLSPQMLVGFKNNGYINERQKVFNTKLSKARVIIENTFALLKGRFRRLKLIEATIPEHVCYIVLVACILHNVCILKGDYGNDIVDVNAERAREIRNDPRNIVDIDLPENNRQAQIKRDEIVNTLLIH